MLQRLCATQDAIAKQAYDTGIFPPEAFQDLNSMAVRIDSIRDRIRQIGSNPLNMGTDAANSELERLRAQLDQAVAEQNELNAAMAAMDVSAANEAYLRLNRTVSGTERYIRDNVDGQGRFNHEMQEGVRHAGSLGSMIRNAAAAYVTIQTAESVIGLSDTMTQTTARLDLIVDDDGSIEELQDRIFASAQNARGSYLATADGIGGNVDMNRFCTDFALGTVPADREDKKNINIQGFQEAANADGYRDAGGNRLAEDGLDGPKTQHVRRQVLLKAKKSGKKYAAGSSGHVVGWWQRRCNEILGHSQAVDGLYGRNARGETLALQRKLRLAEDGIAGYDSIQAAFYN